MKRIVQIIILFLFCFTAMSVASANESVENQAEEILEEKVDSEKSDLTKAKRKLKEMMEIHQESLEENSNDLKLVDGEETGLGSERYNYDRAYQVREVEYFMILEYYNHEENFDEIILDDYYWHVPYTSPNGHKGVAVLMESGNQFEWISETDNEVMEVIMPDEDKLVSIIGNNLGDNAEIKNIEYLYSSLYHMNLVYVCCKQAKYIIPYAEDLESINAYAEDTRIQNGTLYEVKDFMKIMNILFDEEKLKNIGTNVSTGGLMYRQRQPWRLVVMISGCVVFLIVGGVIVYRKWNVQHIQE